jgi:hypothetical protein
MLASLIRIITRNIFLASRLKLTEIASQKTIAIAKGTIITVFGKRYRCRMQQKSLMEIVPRETSAGRQFESGPIA